MCAHIQPLRADRSVLHYPCSSDLFVPLQLPGDHSTAAVALLACRTAIAISVPTGTAIPDPTHIIGTPLPQQPHPPPPHYIIHTKVDNRMSQIASTTYSILPVFDRSLNSNKSLFN